MVFWRRTEVNSVEREKTLAAQIAGKAAEKARRKDVDRTTCMTFNQPKAPTDLKRFESGK